MTAPVQSLKQIFLSALEVAPESRANWLLDACGDDSQLHEQLTRMLEANDTPHSLLDQTAGAIALAARDIMNSASPEDASVHVGACIGPYKLLQKIGEGGMGSVFMAEQIQDVRRKVAIKVIKAGMDSQQVITRFEAERQTLAMLSHMNIASVLDAGTTEGGRPYFVMELLDGTPITEFCDTKRLTLKQRLELFIPVCEAIQHAHQKGIIHRDIKPSNVLVVLYDDRPVPKVIDFGVAKATGMALTEQTINTGMSVIGTPEYMSPEQATLNQLDIDTRSDIYSLGVLLFELLTGTTPFKRKESEKVGILEFLRVIREEEPLRPSSKVATVSSLPSIAANRGIESDRLCAILRNELDWIILKALEKDRARRYETANALIADIKRYLAGEAVLAHPPSTVYRLGKLLRKHKGPAIAASLVFGTLSAGVIGTTLGLLDARTQRVRANEQLDRAMAAEKVAKTRADELKLVSDFQAGMLEQIDPNLAGIELSKDVKTKLDAALSKAGLPEIERSQRIMQFMAQWKMVNPADIAGELIDQTILKPAIESVESRFGDQPLVAAQLRQSLAVAYHELGLYDHAVELQQSIVKTRQELQGSEHIETIRAQHTMGTFLLSMGNLIEAEPLVRETLVKRRRILGNDNQETISSICNLGGLLLDQGRLDQAEPLLEEALAASRKILDEDDTTAITAKSNFGILLWSQGKLKEAESLLREVLQKRTQVLGELHHATLYSKVNLGGLLSAQGNISESEQWLRDALEKSLLLLGTEHSTTLACIAGLGGVLLEQGKLSEAEPLVKESFEKCARLFGQRHKTTLISLDSMGLLLQDQGKPAEAEPLFREALEKCRQALGEDHPQTIRAIDRLGTLLWYRGKMDESEKLTQEALEKSRRVLGKSHPMTLHLLNDSAASYWSTKQLDKSIPIFEELVRYHEATFGRSHQQTLGCIANLGVNYKDASRLAEAIPLLEEAYAASSQMPSLNWIGLQLMQAYISAGQSEKAKELAAELVSKARKNFPPASMGLAGELAGCGEGFLHLQRWTEAESLFRESLSIIEKNQQVDWRLFYFKLMLGEAALALAQYEDADTSLIEGYEGLTVRISNVPPVHLLNVEALIQRVIQFYSANQNQVSAEEWKNRLERIKLLK